MKNNIIKIFVLITLFFSFSFVKAESASPLVDAEYNNIYRGDIVNLDIGFDCKWFQSIVERTEHDYNTYLNGSMYKYKMKDFYIIYNHNIFTLDLDYLNIKNDNYALIDYSFEKIDANNTMIVFEFDIKESFEGGYCSYEGNIIDLFLSDIKFKVNDNAPLGMYYIESSFVGYSYSHFYPIYVISSEKTEDSISDIVFNFYSDYLSFNENYIIKLEENKFDYDLKFFEDSNDLNIYTMCNSKCKIRGIGSYSYIYQKASDEDWNAPYYYKIFVEYESGKKEEYSILDYYSQTFIDDFAITNSNGSAYYIIGNSVYNERIFDYVNILNEKKCEISHNRCYTKVLYYNYDELNEYAKEILAFVKDDIDSSKEPYFFYVENKKLYYEYHGFVESDDDWESIVLLKNFKPIDIVVDESLSSNQSIKDIMDSSMKDRLNELNIKFEFSNFDEFIMNNFTILLIVGICMIILLVFLIILVIRKGKKINNNIDNNLEQTKTLE